MSSFVKPGGSWEPRASARVPEKKPGPTLRALMIAKLKTNTGLSMSMVNVPGPVPGQVKVAPTNNPVEVGRWGGGSFFVGIIDHVAIFNAILSEEDLQSIMEQSLAETLGGEAVSPAG